MQHINGSGEIGKNDCVVIIIASVNMNQFLQIRYSANIFGNSFFPTTIK